MHRFRSTGKELTRSLRGKVRELASPSTWQRWLGLGASLRDLPLRARVYLMCVWAVALILIAWAAREFSWSRHSIFPLLLFSLLFWLLDLFPIILRPNEVEVSLGGSAGIAAIMLLPPPSVALVIFLGSSLAELRFPRPWYKKLFNVGQLVVLCTTLAWAFHRIADQDPLMLTSQRGMIAILTVWVGYYLLNTTFVTLAVSLALKTSPIAVWRANYRAVVLHQLFSAPLGTLLALLIHLQPLAVAFMLPPFFIMYRALGMTAELRERTIEALIAFANSVDARDPSTYQHSERVAELARAIAVQMGLSPDEVETIYLAARLHDLGKVGIPDAILFKPDKLTREEYETIKEHPVISARIIKNFSLFDAGHEIVRYHHERFDGLGYPDGLAGEAIPLGARIIAVADAYDAMISDRPYRAGLPRDLAIRQIVQGRATQFDPDVVDAFLAVMDGAFPNSSLEATEGLALRELPPKGVLPVQSSSCLS